MSPQSGSMERFQVPAESRELRFNQLPISARLEAVLGRTSHRKLADLDGLVIADFRLVRRCGRVAMRELRELAERVAAGAFSLTAEQVAKLTPADFVRVVDGILKELETREREILLLRYGGRGKTGLALARIGSRYKLTRERVRQVLELLVATVRRWQGPRLPAITGCMAARCDEEVAPLTPELLGAWLRGTRVTPAYPLRFYVSLAGELDERVPAWPRGQQCRSFQQRGDAAIGAAVGRVLKRGRGILPLKEAYAATRKEEAFAQLPAGKFLGALKYSENLRVTFPSPAAPRVRVRRLRAAEIARSVLEASDKPLAVEQIIERGGAIFGKDLVSSKPRAMANCLVPAKGFYLLGPRTYGLRAHFRLPESQWQQVRDDIHKFLSSCRLPVSAYALGRQEQFSWLAQTTAYEIAQLLREDKRFKDLGKLLFSLVGSGVEKREPLRDLVVSALAEAGRPLAKGDLFERIRGRWPVSSRSYSAGVGRHPAVKCYGFDYYGLKAWGEAGQQALAGDPVAIERVLQRAGSMKFGRLCQGLGIAPKSPLVAKLWETCCALSEVERSPDRCAPETRLTCKGSKAVEG